MSTARMTLAIAAGFAAGLLLAGRRQVASARLPGRRATIDRPDDATRAGVDAPVDADSPNAAERLAARGDATTSGNGAPADMLASTTQWSESAERPGLPDFFRGA